MRARSFGGGGLLLPSGARIFISGYANDKIYQYDMTTPGDISTASFTQDFSVSAQDTQPAGIFFKPDGLKMYVVGRVNRTIYQYNLTSPYDISTASFFTSRSVLTQDDAPVDLYISDDGLKMFMLGNSNDYVYEYNLTNPWTINSATYTFKRFYTFTYESAADALTFNPDGTKMYFGGSGNGRIHEFTLSTPFDFAGTETYVGNSFYQSPNGFCFNEDGTKAYSVKGYSDDLLYEWNLSTPYDSLSNTVANTFSLGPRDSAPVGVFLNRAVYS